MAKRITKREFYDKGGFANSKLYRKARPDGAWTYWELVD